MDTPLLFCEAGVPRIFLRITAGASPRVFSHCGSLSVKLTQTFGKIITPNATTPWIIVSSSRRSQCLPGMMTLLCHPICERESTTVPPSLPTWEDRFNCSVPSFILDQPEPSPVPHLCSCHPPNVSNCLFGSVVSQASAFRRYINIKLHNYLCLLRISYSSYLLT